MIWCILGKYSYFNPAQHRLSNFATFSIGAFTYPLMVCLNAILNKTMGGKFSKQSDIKGNQCKRAIIRQNQLFMLWENVMKHCCAMCIVLKHFG